MTQEQKIIRAKVGLLELARQLGNGSQACKMLGYSRDSLDLPRKSGGSFAQLIAVISYWTGLLKSRAECRLVGL